MEDVKEVDPVGSQVTIDGEQRDVEVEPGCRMRSIEEDLATWQLATALPLHCLWAGLDRQRSLGKAYIPCGQEPPLLLYRQQGQRKLLLLQLEKSILFGFGSWFG